MGGLTVGIGILNTILILVLWHKTWVMTQLIFILGELAGICDEKGRPV